MKQDAEKHQADIAGKDLETAATISRDSARNEEVETE